MAILIDYSGVAISSVMVQLNYMEDLEEELIRHIVLNIIRSARSKYHNQFGEVVICCDSQGSWRKQIFPYYKAARKQARKESAVDWQELYRIIDQIKLELDEHFPYKVLKVPTAEADDIIATIAIREKGPHMIVSNDKDFLQLQRVPGVAIYSPLKGRKIVCPNPDRFLIEHIIRGDAGDGVPNVLSDDDCLVMKKRQKPIRTKKLEEWVASLPERVFDEETYQRYQRNEALISLFRIPEDVSEEIWKAYTEYEMKGGRGSPLLSFFVQKKLRNLLHQIEDF